MPTHTVGEILDRYELEVSPSLRPRTQRDYKRFIEKIRARFGSRRADTISRSDFEAFVSESKGNVQRLKVLKFIQRLYTLASRDWGWLEFNVLQNIQREKARPKARRYVTNDEVESLSMTLSYSSRLAMFIAVETGLSQGAILSLKWGDIGPSTVRSYEFGTIKPIEIPISPRLRALLEERRKKPISSEYLVCTKTGERYTSEGFRALWQRKIKRWTKDGGTPFRFHDLRFKWQDDNATHDVLPEIQAIVARPQETLRVELKSWIDIGTPSSRAKVARALAALCNNGGGFLIFGFQKDGTASPNHPGDLRNYTHDQISGIVDRYLTPSFHCKVQTVLPTGAADTCIVITVPSHGSVPICAKRNGPNDEHDRPIAIVQGTYYIRVPGPKSVPIESPDQWRDLIRRCVIHEREQLLLGIEQLLRPTVLTAQETTDQPSQSELLL